jgi:folate-binding protein YgfZ
VRFAVSDSTIMTEDTARRSVLRGSESVFVTDLAAWAALRIDGEDAREFLQNQLSSDVYALSEGNSQWSSYNSPKGRVLASLRLWRDPEASNGFGALIASDLAASISKRLSMFVLRAKARIGNQSTTHPLIGVGGPRAADVIANILDISVSADGASGIADDEGTVVGLGDGRFVIVSSAARAAALRSDITKAAVAADESVWRWLSIRAGVPVVTAATTDQFVPQMLNWDALGGISFQKGCYPGQEIVARMRYLGRLKERLYRFHVATDSEPTPGMRLYGSAFGATPCGTVINAAPAPEGGCGLLAVAQIAAVETGALTLGTEHGPSLTRVALPYSVPENESPRGRLA